MSERSSIPALDWLVILYVAACVATAVALFVVDQQTNAGFPVVPAIAPKVEPAPAVAS